MDITLVVITLLSLALALTMGVVAWRMARAEQRRSQARVAALAEEIRGVDLPRSSDPDEDDLTLNGVAVRNLFATTQPTTDRSPAPTIVAGCALVAAAAVAVAVVSTRADDTIRSASPLTSATPAAHNRVQSGTSRPLQPPTLELLSLEHERGTDKLTVRGIVRTPPAGPDLRGVTAVVSLFNHDGDLLASGRATLEAGIRDPGREARFEVTMPAAAGVERYRVGFRTDDEALPHVDRRS